MPKPFHPPDYPLFGRLPVRPLGDEGPGVLVRRRALRARLIGVTEKQPTNGGVKLLPQLVEWLLEQRRPAERGPQLFGSPIGTFEALPEIRVLVQVIPHVGPSEEPV